ncbi:MAG: GIY-YIG nuclease family protein, partial [Candidatus Hydrogenedentes bacterium]|nr:GIY-YIG nuclease family protein [Candidatus Hydrogenedentota bacterium]
MKNYYVYVYIDPRNFEEFYYGKGKDSRKTAHLSSKSDSEMTRRIGAIRQEGLEPIIRVIAAGLTEREAFLIETTLIWKLGKFTANVASGVFSGKFRPHDTLHVELSDFDYQNGIYYYNVGEGEVRNWDDYMKHGFISAGQGEQWRDPILGFRKGDVVVAYLKGHGYVGIGKITEPAKRIRDARIRKRPLLDLDLVCPNMGKNSNSTKKSEYV